MKSMVPERSASKRRKRASISESEWPSEMMVIAWQEEVKWGSE